MTQIPRPEHPQPQMKREHWKNLNGEWDFSFDFGCSGIDQKWQEGKTDWEKKILVPFCPESDLSGIGYKDFIPGVWYHRTITLTEKKKLLPIFLNEFKASPRKLIQNDY